MTSNGASHPNSGGAPGRLTDRMPGWSGRVAAAPLIGVLLGEGVGPEVVGAALGLLDALKGVGLRLEIRPGPDDCVGLSACPSLADEVVGFCDSIFAEGGAMFCGPVGGRFVYELRSRFDLYCKVVPLRPCLAIADASIVRPELLRGVDMLLVRENAGGIYLGEFGRRDGGRIAYQHASYSVDQVSRIIDIAVELARARRGKLSVVVKRGGIPEVSALWSEQAEAVAANRGIALEILEADNAGFQLIAQPRRFDVIVTSNLFGDILADAATILLASRGMSYSANFGRDGRAVYQTGHGAAHDLTDLDTANPVAQILSLATMLRESFGLEAAARGVETAVERVLASGFRTPDIAGPGSRVIGTRELAARIAAEAVPLVSGDGAC